MSEHGDFAIVSSGDDDADQKALREFVRRDNAIQAGMCPNGCGGMREVDPHNAECLKCGFGYFAAGGLNFKHGDPA